MKNKINTSVQVVSGKRVDERENPWAGVSAALAGITGTQRQRGQLIPVDINGITIQYHFQGGLADSNFVPYDSRINLEDALIFAGATVDLVASTVTLEDTEWRISNLLFKLPATIVYLIPAPDAGGLLRQDNIIASYNGSLTYQTGVAGVIADAPQVPYKNILVTSFIVSLANGVEEVPTPIPVTDGETLYGPADPINTQGKNGDSYVNTTNGKEFKKETVSGEVVWVLKYTPASADITNKVDKVEGKSLIDDTEIARLAGVSNKFDGTFISLAALQAAFPTSLEGHEALVDPGTGTAATKYIWDMQEGWVPGGGAGASTFAELTGDPADNALLEARFTAKEPTVAPGNADQYYAGDKTWKSFLTSVLGSALTGISFASKAAITATSTILQALGQLQAQITFFKTEAYSFAVSDEATTVLSAGVAKISFRMPYGFILSSVRASLNEAPAGSTFIVNIKHNGTTIFSTNLSINSGALTSTTATSQAVISNANLLDDSLITVDIVQVGSTTAGKGLKISFIGTKS